MDPPLEFLLYRVSWMTLYWLQAGLALWVLYWFGGSVIRHWLAGAPLKGIDGLILGMSTVALATALNGLLWLPGHYYQGLGQPLLAALWGRRIWPVMLALQLIHIGGYIVHVYFALRTDPDRWRHILTPLAVWSLIGFFTWAYMGGWGYRYK